MEMWIALTAQVCKLQLRSGQRACQGSPGAPYPRLGTFFEFFDMELCHVLASFVSFKHRVSFLEFTLIPVNCNNQVAMESVPVAVIT